MPERHVVDDTTVHEAPAIVVDCSTVSAEASAEVRTRAAARGTAFLAAPVSGNGRVVRAGLLSLVVSLSCSIVPTSCHSDEGVKGIRIL